MEKRQLAEWRRKIPKPYPENPHPDPPMTPLEKKGF
jgi:hypothetical protein